MTTEEEEGEETTIKCAQTLIVQTLRASYIYHIDHKGEVTHDNVRSWHFRLTPWTHGVP